MVEEPLKYHHGPVTLSNEATIQWREIHCLSWCLSGFMFLYSIWITNKKNLDLHENTQIWATIHTKNVSCRYFTRKLWKTIKTIFSNAGKKLLKKKNWIHKKNTWTFSLVCGLTGQQTLVQSVQQLLINLTKKRDWKNSVTSVAEVTISAPFWWEANCLL